MSMLQYGLPALPAGEDIPQDTVVKKDGDEYKLVEGPDDIDDDDLIGIADVSADKGEVFSPKRGIVDYARVNGEIEINAGDKLEVADDGEVGVFDDGESGHVCIGRAGSDAVEDRLVRVEFATLMEVAE